MIDTEDHTHGHCRSAAAMPAYPRAHLVVGAVGSPSSGP